jgi:hypothetical protein
VLEVLQNPLVIIFGSVTIMAGLPTLAHYWYKARKAELEASLKHEMLQRGMSADEICQVLEATSDGVPKQRLRNTAPYSRE